MIIVNDDNVYKSAMYFWVCREGLSTRPVASSDEIQLRIDPMHADFDDEITGLRSQVRKLRHVRPSIFKLLNFFYMLFLNHL